MMIKSTFVIFGILILSGCVESAQNLQSINQTLGNAQRTVDYANSVSQIPATDKKRAIKDMGKAVIQQNPTAQQANETIKATKALTKSVKALGQ